MLKVRSINIREKGNNLYFKRSLFHRVINTFMIQTFKMEMKLEEKVFKVINLTMKHSFMFILEKVYYLWLILEIILSLHFKYSSFGFLILTMKSRISSYGFLVLKFY